MSKSVFVGNNPTIQLDKIGGDLSVVGWEGAELLIKSDEDDARVEQMGETVSVSSGSDLSLRLPKGASLAIKFIGGDASIRGVLGGLEIKEIHGDLSIREAGSISIDARSFASVQTRASLRDGRWVIDGQKIWTSGAQNADFCFVLCRTSPEAPRHAGLVQAHHRNLALIEFRQIAVPGLAHDPSPRFSRRSGAVPVLAQSLTADLGAGDRAACDCVPKKHCAR